MDGRKEDVFEPEAVECYLSESERESMVLMYAVSRYTTWCDDFFGTAEEHAIMPSARVMR